MMNSRLKRISSLIDVNLNETLPISERNLAKNTYEVFDRAARKYANKIALRFLFAGNQEENSFNYSYGEILNYISQTANAFQKVGIGHKDVVSILLPNLPQNHFALWGAQTVGIASPLNPLLEVLHIIGIMNESKAKVLVTLAPFPNNHLWEKVQAIAQHVPTLKTILTINLAQFSNQISSQHTSTKITNMTVIDFDQFIAEQANHLPLGFCEKKPDDAACYFHTGGTTGLPKIAIHSHSNQIFCAWMTGQQLSWNEKDIVHAGLPLFHVNAPLISGLAPFTVGAEVLLTSPQGFRSPTVIDNFWKLVEKYKITFFMGVPTVYVALNKRWDDKVDISSLKIVACGAAPMPTALIKEFQERTQVRILEGYGLTEGGVLSSVNPYFGESQIGSIGIRIPYQEMKTVILDEQGQFLRNCKPNEIGTITIRGPNVFQGYLRLEDNKNIWLGEGWLNTGDLGRENEQGYFTITGRKKDLIIRGGHNIDPQIIEEALAQHPAVAMVAAVGKPDVKMGELPVAFVTLHDGQTIKEEELLAFAVDKISEHVATPVDIYIIEKMPLTAVGKIYKPQLRFDAIKLTFDEILMPLGLDIKIAVEPHSIHGQLATIIIPENASKEIDEQIHFLLKGFSVAIEVY